MLLVLGTGKGTRDIDLMGKKRQFAVPLEKGGKLQIKHSLKQISFKRIPLINFVSWSERRREKERQKKSCEWDLKLAEGA